MRILDVQIHEPAPAADWSGDAPDVQRRMLAEAAFGWLNGAGVDGVVLFPGDVAWGAWAAEAFPERFACVQHITPDAPDIDGAVRAAKQRRANGQVGLRAIIGWPIDGREVRRFEAGAWDPVFAACETHQVPLFVFLTRWLAHIGDIARRYPRLILIVDHIGLPQPPMDDREEPPLKSLPEFLTLAKFPNVHVKLCGLPSLSREAYPFNDVAPALRALVDAFGENRLMWGSDTTRFFGRFGLGRHQLPRTDKPYPGKHTYAEALQFIRGSAMLSVAEKEAILGGTLQRVLGWPND